MEDAAGLLSSRRAIPLTLYLLALFTLWSAICWFVFRWTRLPVAFRDWISRGLLAAALACFALAPFLQGRYSQDVTLFVYPNPHVVETIERSYRGLATGVGVAFLFMFALALRGDRLPWKTPLGNALKLTVTVLLLRVYLEKLGVSLDVAVPVGVIWLIVPVGVYLGICARSFRNLVGFVVGYALSVRVLIVIVMLVLSHLQLGTHFDNSGITSFTLLDKEYDVEAGSWEQYRVLILEPQLTFWLGVTIASGFLFGVPSYLWASRQRRQLTSS